MVGLSAQGPRVRELKAEATMPTDDLVVLATFPNRIEADLAQSALTAGGVDSIVHADDAGGEQPGLWVGEGVQLLVRASEAEFAKEIMAGTGRGETSGE